MVEVLKIGILDSIQDLGRTKVQSFGVPFSGVMDHYSAKLANEILGNSIKDAVIESAIKGPKLKFHLATTICLTGADASPMINGKSVKMNSAINVYNDDVLSFGLLKYGCRIYIAIAGGFKTEVVLDSRSMFPNLTSKIRLEKGDVLSVMKLSGANVNSHTTVKPLKSHFESKQIEVFKGPEFEKLPSGLQSELFSNTFTVSNLSNRMAYQFNERLDNDLESIITSLVLPGTLQLTPSGQLIILMRDCQTTGGYPRILQLTSMSINKLSQKFLGEKIQFKCIN